MKKTVFLTYALILTVMATGCTPRAYRDNKTMQNETEERPVAQGNNQFAFDLLQEIPFTENNMVVSPFSISTALAMTYTGARNTTMLEMARVMHFDKDQQRFRNNFRDYLVSLQHMASNDVQLNVANSLWAQEDYHFLEQFFEINKNYFNSETFLVNFETNREQVRKEINDWVYEETREKIKDLIVPGVLTEDTRLVLVNAIHFFGPWLTEFNPDNTRENIFYVSEAERVMADFMHRTDTLAYAENDKLQALELPYAGKDFSMLVLLPKHGTSLEEIHEILDPDYYNKIIGEMQKQEVDVFLPKFEAETKFDLEDVLMKMGMVDPFTRRADFSGMTGDLELKIDKVIHQAMIEVAEEGTEAAAATAVVIIRKTSIDPDPRTVFMANRPFIFFIKDNQHHSILFAGRVMNPGE